MISSSLALAEKEKNILMMITLPKLNVPPQK
jgi:hypothetical protein